ncbi:MAG: FtsX-like permease family protein [bacterium]|nr:FtsX-like permease family protein [bacterium]
MDNKKIRNNTPFIGRWLFGRLVKSCDSDLFTEDLKEVYTDICRGRGKIKAYIWFWSHLMRSIPAFFKTIYHRSAAMFKNYFKIAFRNLSRHKGYSFINISGLAIGMACCIMILLWVQDELNYDKFHENLEDLYIVGTISHMGDVLWRTAGTPPAIGPALKEEYPEVVNSARLNNGTSSVVLSYGEQRYDEEIQAADNALFSIFTIPFIKGDPEKALIDPHSIVMTESTAKKYFGDEDPIGKVVSINNQFTFTVTGVIEEYPHNTRFRSDLYVPLFFLEEYYGRKGYTGTWFNLSFRTYVQLREGAVVDEFNEKIFDRISRVRRGDDCDAFVWPYSELYLNWLGQGGGRMEQVRMFSMIAVFVLLIACINFMNLTTARSGNRSKEIGMRKVAGAYKRDIIKQFYGESIIVSFISMLLGLIIVGLLLPSFNDLTGKLLSINFLGNPGLILIFIGIAILTGLISGSYPALFMSSFKPLSIIKGALSGGRGNSVFRKALVVLQFALSITLIIRTYVVYDQMNFIREKNLGFDKEHLLYIRVNGALTEHSDTFKQELYKNPNILNASVTSHSPTGIYWNGSGWDWEGKDANFDPLVTYFSTDYDFVETFKVEMLKGEFYTEDKVAGSSQTSGKMVINETFAKMIGKEDIIGTQITQGGRKATIIGVMKDFNFKPLYNEIGAINIYLNIPRRNRFIFLRLKGEDISETINYIGEVYRTFNPEFPYTYRFLDDDYDLMYRSEERSGKIVNYFAGLTVFISCLGLFGLASFMAEQKTKEIGIRKVLGASVQTIINLLSKEFIILVSVANVIAWPAAYYLSRNWLEDFSYRISLGWQIFLISGLAAILIAVLTVGFQSVKAARANPSDSLKYE